MRPALHHDTFFALTLIGLLFGVALFITGTSSVFSISLITGALIGLEDVVMDSVTIAYLGSSLLLLALLVLALIHIVKRRHHAPFQPVPAEQPWYTEVEETVPPASGVKSKKGISLPEELAYVNRRLAGLGTEDVRRPLPNLVPPRGMPAEKAPVQVPAVIEEPFRDPRWQKRLADVQRKLKGMNDNKNTVQEEHTLLRAELSQLEEEIAQLRHKA